MRFDQLCSFSDRARRTMETLTHLDIILPRIGPGVAGAPADFPPAATEAIAGRWEAAVRANLRDTYALRHATVTVSTLDAPADKILIATEPEQVEDHLIRELSLRVFDLLQIVAGEGPL